MLWTIAVILFVLWILGFLAFHVASPLIHLLLVVAVVAVAVEPDDPRSSRPGTRVTGNRALALLVFPAPRVSDQHGHDQGHPRLRPHLHRYAQQKHFSISNVNAQRPLAMAINCTP